jgi:hypothetical protein
MWMQKDFITKTWQIYMPKTNVEQTKSNVGF